MNHFDDLEAQIKYSGPNYAMKFLRTTNVLFGKKQAKYSMEGFAGHKADLSEIRDKVYQKLADDCEDPAIMSN